MSRLNIHSTKPSPILALGCEQRVAQGLPFMTLKSDQETQNAQSASSHTLQLAKHFYSIRSVDSMSICSGFQ